MLLYSNREQAKQSHENAPLAVSSLESQVLIDLIGKSTEMSKMNLSKTSSLGFETRRFRSEESFQGLEVFASGKTGTGPLFFTRSSVLRELKACTGVTSILKQKKSRAGCDDTTSLSPGGPANPGHATTHGPAGCLHGN